MTWAVETSWAQFATGVNSVSFLLNAGHEGFIDLSMTPLLSCC